MAIAIISPSSILTNVQFANSQNSQTHFEDENGNGEGIIEEEFKENENDEGNSESQEEEESLENEDEEDSEGDEGHTDEGNDENEGVNTGEENNGSEENEGEEEETEEDEGGEEGEGDKEGENNSVNEEAEDSSDDEDSESSPDEDDENSPNEEGAENPYDEETPENSSDDEDSSENSSDDGNSDDGNPDDEDPDYENPDEENLGDEPSDRQDERIYINLLEVDEQVIIVNNGEGIEFIFNFAPINTTEEIVIEIEDTSIASFGDKIPLELQTGLINFSAERSMLYPLSVGQTVITISAKKSENEYFTVSTIIVVQENSPTVLQIGQLDLLSDFTEEDLMEEIGNISFYEINSLNIGASADIQVLISEQIKDSYVYFDPADGLIISVNKEVLEDGNVLITNTFSSSEAGVYLVNLIINESVIYSFEIEVKSCLDLFNFHEADKRDNVVYDFLNNQIIFSNFDNTSGKYIVFENAYKDNMKVIFDSEYCEGEEVFFSQIYLDIKKVGTFILTITNLTSNISINFTIIVE